MKLKNATIEQTYQTKSGIAIKVMGPGLAPDSILVVNVKTGRPLELSGEYLVIDEDGGTPIEPASLIASKDWPALDAYLRTLDELELDEFLERYPLAKVGELVRLIRRGAASGPATDESTADIGAEATPVEDDTTDEEIKVETCAHCDALTALREQPVQPFGLVFATHPGTAEPVCPGTGMTASATRQAKARSEGRLYESITYRLHLRGWEASDGAAPEVVAESPLAAAKHFLGLYPHLTTTDISWAPVGQVWIPTDPKFHGLFSIEVITGVKVEWIEPTPPAPTEAELELLKGKDEAVAARLERVGVPPESVGEGAAAPPLPTTTQEQEQAAAEVQAAADGYVAQSLEGRALVLSSNVRESRHGLSLEQDPDAIRRAIVLENDKPKPRKTIIGQLTARLNVLTGLSPEPPKRAAPPAEPVVEDAEPPRTNGSMITIAGWAFSTSAPWWAWWGRIGHTRPGLEPTWISRALEDLDPVSEDVASVIERLDSIETAISQAWPDDENLPEHVCHVLQWFADETRHLEQRLAVESEPAPTEIEWDNANLKRDPAPAPKPAEPPEVAVDHLVIVRKPDGTEDLWLREPGKPARLLGDAALPQLREAARACRAAALAAARTPTAPVPATNNAGPVDAPTIRGYDTRVAMAQATLASLAAGLPALHALGIDVTITISTRSTP